MPPVRVKPIVWGQRLLRASLRAYNRDLKVSEGQKTGLCSAFDAGVSDLLTRWPSNAPDIYEANRILRIRAEKYRNRRLYELYIPYWWGFKPSGVRSRRRVFSRLGDEYGITL